jgi:hypothetical protein
VALGNPKLFAGIAEANGLIGAAEELLWPAERVVSEVAILYPRCVYTPRTSITVLILVLYSIRTMALARLPTGTSREFSFRDELSTTATR